MRVSCSSMKDFVANLRAEGPDKIFGRVVRVEVSRNRIEECKVPVTIQASAVIDLGEEDGQYLLEMGQDCGVDWEDGECETEGSDLAIALKRELTNALAELGGGIDVRPGVISL